MSLFKQTFIIFFLLQILFGAFHYRYKPEIFYIFKQLIKPRYLVTSLVISIAYFFVTAILGYLLS